MLWDIIRDWFVMNIWGGTLSTEGIVDTFFGYVSTENNGDIPILGNEVYLPFNGYTDSQSDLIKYINFADWLSTTSTIIVLIALCFFFFLMVRWLFRLTAGLIQGRG